MQAYSNPKRESDPYALPDIEVFELTAAEIAETMADEIWEAMKLPQFRLASMNSRDRDKLIDYLIAEHSIEGGWFWQACFPGCLPEGDPIGPFSSYKEALADAREGVEG